jgi:hypothetical protein
MAMEHRALLLIDQVMRDFALRELDLQVALRRCQHACELLGWQARKEWFYLELNGYGEVAPLPAYRFARGRLIWQPASYQLEHVEWLADELRHLPGAGGEEEEVPAAVRNDIAWLLQAAQHGHVEPAGERMEVWSRARPEMVRLERMRVFPAAQYAAILFAIQQRAFNFASQAHALLLAAEATAQEPREPDGADHEQVNLFVLLSGERVTLGDLKDICFRLELDWEALPGDAKADKARELVQHCARRNALGDLRGAVALSRPDLQP